MNLDKDANDTSTSSNDVTLDDANDNLQLDDNGQRVEGADGADSSDAHGDNVDQGTAGIVRDVVTKGRDPATASPAEGDEQKDTKGEGAKAEDDEEYSDVPFHKHPRFQHLLRKSKESTEDAGRYRNVQRFMTDNSISDQETANAFQFMAAFKQGRFTEAWEMIKPTVQDLLVRAGEVLPEDLKAEVDAGTLTSERASELSHERAKSKALEQGRSFDQQRQERSSTAAQSQALHDTAVGWSKDRAKKDPQFDAKMPLLMKEVAWLQSESRGKEGFDDRGRPLTQEGVQKQLEQAYKAVTLPASRTAQGGKTAPRVGDGVARQRPTAAGGASGTARPKARSTLDIIRGVVEQRAG